MRKPPTEEQRLKYSAQRRAKHAANPEILREYLRAYRGTRRELMNDQQRARRQTNKDMVNAAKTAPCFDCGIHYPPYVMDFDHVRGIKIREVSDMWTQAASTILDEIGKCDLVCSNCHRQRTHQRREGA